MEFKELEKLSGAYLNRISSLVESHVNKTKKMVQKLERLDKDLQAIVDEQPRTRKKREIKHGTNNKEFRKTEIIQK